ncbi:MFS transporter, partial [Candidatus Accumulibacter phosphatis]|nr:MFS transporter [Candidatus Accumulibacter phosphatis]
MSSQFGLLKARRFAPFFGTQFLGAFNDNLYKNALVVLLTFQAASWTTLTPEVL